MVHGHKSDWQASLWRRGLWYLRWLLYRQIIILSIRVPFSTLWSLQCLMACFHRTVSTCLHSHHYPTRSPVLLNDKRLEYWFVNLQSGAIPMQTAELYEFNKCRGICSESGVFVWAETSTSTNYSSSYCNSVVDAQWLGWMRVVDAETRAAAGESWPDMYQANHSFSQSGY